MATLMGFAKDFVEMLVKEKWVVYLFLLWAGAFFFWGLDGLLNYRSEWSLTIANLLYLVAGIVLALFAIKSLKSGFLETLSKVRAFAYFLLLWGGASFFFAVHDLANYATSLGLLASLFYLLSGVLLILFGFKLFQSKE